MIRHAWKASNEVICFFHRVNDISCLLFCELCNFDDFIALDQILIWTILLDVLLIVLIFTLLDHRDIDQDEEKFQREILSDEPNLIKLYLQVPQEFHFFLMVDEF